MHTPVLILDGEQKAALAVTRSLGARGVPVFVASSDANALSSVSRYCSGYGVLPRPDTDQDAYVAEIRRLCQRFSIGILMPITDISTMLVLREEWNNLRLASPTPRAYDSVSDKSTLIRSAKLLGVPIPATDVAQEPEHVEEIIRQFDGPVVIKPARSRYIMNNTLLSTSVILADSPSDALQRLRKATWFGAIPCLIQQYIDGQSTGVFSLYDHTGPVAWFAHKRIREKPPSGGVSVLCESIPLDMEMRDYSERLLTDAGWSGPAMVEFKVSTNGTPYLMEINGRFWGSLQLSIDCGIDFPWLFYQIVTDQSVDAIEDYLTERRLRWLLGDLDSMYLTLKDRNRPIWERARRVAAFMNFFDYRTRSEIFRWNDARPFLRELRNWFRDLSLWGR